jgi:hypothetical protein
VLGGIGCPKIGCNSGHNSVRVFQLGAVYGVSLDVSDENLASSRQFLRLRACRTVPGGQLRHPTCHVLATATFVELLAVVTRAGQCNRQHREGVTLDGWVL